MTNKTRKSPTIEALLFRHNAKNAIRSMFDDQGFIELDTPYLLSSNTPDPHIDPVIATVKSGGGQTFQLHTSPEIWLKKGLGVGLEKIYQIARVFRDDPVGAHHSREFTMIEWYRTEATLSDLLVDCEEIFARSHQIAVTQKLIAPSPVPVFQKTDLETLFAEIANIDLTYILKAIASGDHQALQKLLITKGEHLPKNSSFSDAFFHVMLKYIEPNLPFNEPVVISRWPIQLAALADPCDDDRNYCDRFEIYFRGLEIANAYQECTDANVLRARFNAENLERQSLNKPIFVIDETFLVSVGKMPKTAGIALGLDRLFMAILQKMDISEIFFGLSDR